MCVPAPKRASAKRRLQSRLLIAAAITFGLFGMWVFGKGAFIHVKAMVAQVLLEDAFAKSVAEGRPVKPWSWADTWPVARLSVPRLEKSAIVLYCASGQAMAFGPGHMRATPRPGARGTSVIAAHRDTHFAFLKNVVVGDLIEVARRDGKRFRFEVTATEVVRWDAAEIDVYGRERMLVLATCWPFGARQRGPLRYLVRAKFVDQDLKRPENPLGSLNHQVVNAE